MAMIVTSEQVKAKVLELKQRNPELSAFGIEKILEGTKWEVSNDIIYDII